MPIVVNGAICKCAFGTNPSALFVAPGTIFASGLPVAHISDFVPMLNIKPFGNCITLSNPVVAAATAAKLGTLTPMPCIPIIPAPWTSAKPSLSGILHSTCKCMCVYGGVIQIINPGQVSVL
ncbi:MAG: DUF4280 domain-containing protein [Alphaproteobacteria bacterium]|nr:DUF4280 domain-containing protein [Alphaproteobacteria bacterium]